MRNGGNWTEGRYRAFITSVLRGGARRWPVKFKVLKEAAIGKEINPRTKRLAMMYRCAACKKKYSSSEINVDHINPVVDPDKGFISWDNFIERLFCEEEGLQVLCKTCHDLKSKKERQKRKKNAV